MPDLIARIRPVRLLPGALFAIAAAFHMSYAGYGIPVFDLGILLGDTDRVLNGEVFGRDFIAPYGPGSYYIMAPLLLLLGRSLFAVSVVFALLRALLDVAIYRVAVPLMGRAAALLPFALAAVAHGSFHKSFLVLAQVVSLFALATMVRRASVRHALLAGALCGVASLLRYDVGVFAFVALCVASMLLPEIHGVRVLVRHCACLAAGAMLALGPAAAFLLARGLDVRWWWDHVWQRIRVQEGISASLPNAIDGLRRGDWKPVVLVSWIALGVLLPIVASLIALGGNERRSKRGATVVGLAVFGLAMMNQVRLIPSLNHFLQVATTPYILLAWVLALVLRGWFARGGVRRACALVLFVLPWCVTAWRVGVGADDSYPGSFAMARRAAVMLPGARGGALAPVDQVRAIAAIEALVRSSTQASDRIVTASNCPLFYFLCDRAPAIPFVEPAYYYQPERYEQEAIAALERWQPPVFIDDARPAATFSMPRAARTFYEHLMRTYRPEVAVPPFTLLRRAR